MKQMLIVFACIAWLIPSRSHAEPELGFAVKGGFAAATLDEDFRVNRFGFTGGLSGYLQWSLGDSFAIAGQIDLLYTPRGAEVIYEGEYVGKSRQHYIDLPLAVRPTARFGWASVYLLLGGSLDLLLSADKEDVAGAKQDITGDLRRVDVALLVGAGVALRLPSRQLGPLRLGAVFLEARHDRGLIDTDAVNGGFKNRTSSLMLGLSFALASDASPPPPPPPPTNVVPAN